MINMILLLNSCKILQLPKDFQNKSFIISNDGQKMMLKDNKCYGKVQGPETFSTHFSQKECEIFNYNKKEWELIWRK